MKLKITKIKIPIRKALVILAAALFFGTALGRGADICRRVLFEYPCRVKIDCRGKGISLETFKEWEKRGKDSLPGIIRIAGWRAGGQREIFSPSTGRKQTAQVICVFGSMELAEPAEILSGRYGLAAGEDFCVLTEALSRNLFGSTDTVGERITVNGKRREVIGVIAREEDFLFIPMEDGEAEQLAAEFKGRFGAKEGIKRLLGE